jgi:hypothetical protein
MATTFKIETREETIAKYREDFIDTYARRAFNFEEALAEFDKDPESFDMEFYTLGDVVVAKLKEHPNAENIRSDMFYPYNHNCSNWGWFCKPGHYPSITF